MSISKTVLLFLFSLLISANLAGQEYLDKPTDNRTAFGVFAGVGLNQHTADFVGVDFPQIPSCCPRFETGSGFGYNFGFLYDFRLK